MNMKEMLDRAFEAGRAAERQMTAIYRDSGITASQEAARPTETITDDPPLLPSWSTIIKTNKLGRGVNFFETSI